MQQLSKFIYFKILRWKLEGDFPGHLNKFVIIVVPHTSWVDFFLGLLIRRVWNEEINFIAKKSLFAFPFGYYFRWMGGTPIDRSKHNNVVSATVAIFEEKKKFRLTIAPEGTRKKVSGWKTGFYFIAKQANVPIVPIAFDFGKKLIKVGAPQYTSNNQETDFKNYETFFKGVKGYVAENSF